MDWKPRGSASVHSTKTSSGDQPVQILWHHTKNLLESRCLDSSTGGTRGLYSYLAISSYTHQLSVICTLVQHCSNEKMGTTTRACSVWQCQKRHWMDNNNKNTNRWNSAGEHVHPRSKCSMERNTLPTPGCQPAACAHRCHKIVTGLYTMCSSSWTKWPVHRPSHCTVSSAELNTWRSTSTLTYTLHGKLLNLRDNVVPFHSFSFIFYVYCLTM
jgi:hypothetical protein